MINFDRVWNAYPQDYYPCRLENDDPAYPNQCAIRFGLSLIDGGVDTSGFDGTRCWYGHGARHILRGEEIAAYMKKNPRIFGRVRIVPDANESTFLGRRGFIFCRNFWGDGNQGDHIDLWNRNHMKTGDPSYITRSEETWFWQVDANIMIGKTRNKRGSKLKRATAPEK